LESKEGVEKMILEIAIAFIVIMFYLISRDKERIKQKEIEDEYLRERTKPI
jgi:hypothetical protein